MAVIYGINEDNDLQIPTIDKSTGAILSKDSSSATIAAYAAQGCTSVTADSSANATLTMTVAAVNAKSHYLYSFGVSISGAALSSSITATIKDGSTSIYKVNLGVGSPVGEARYRVFSVPIKITANTNLVLEVTAGGAGVITTGNLVYITR